MIHDPIQTLSLDRIGTASGQACELVENERAGNGNVEGMADAHHGYLDRLIQVWPYLGRQSRVFMSEEYDASSDSLTNLTE